MNSAKWIQEISDCLKSRQFEEAATLLKVYQINSNGRITFKLLRSLVIQLKQNSCIKDSEISVDRFIRNCCAILNQSEDLSKAEDREFIQGCLSLYHLVTLSLSSDKNEIVILLSKTFLICLRNMDRSLQDVEGIAANMYNQLWKKTTEKKENSELCFSYRSVALLLLVHGGSSFWNRLIEKLTNIVQETSNTSFQLTEPVFDEVLLYCNKHKIKGSACVSSLLQVWMHLVFFSNSSNQHQDQTSKLKLLAKEIEEKDQVVILIELVLKLFGVSDCEVDFTSPKWNNFSIKNFEIAFARITLLSLSYIQVLSHSAKETWDRQNQIVSMVNLLLYICQESDRIGSIFENLQIDPIKLRINCLLRACFLSINLLHLDFSNICLCIRVFHHIDLFKKQGIVETNKYDNYLNSAEIFAHNVGAFLSQKPDKITAVIYFRKALKYHLMNLSETKHPCNGEVPIDFPFRFKTLFDARRVACDWTGIIEDFALCFSTFHEHYNANAMVRCKSTAIEQYLLVEWSRFKRDVHRDSRLTSSSERFLEITVLDVFKQKNVELDNDSAWNLLFEEYQMLDRRKESMPKAAFSAVVRQASALAKSSFQKGICSCLLSREGDDFVKRHKAANKAIEKLALPLQMQMTDNQTLGQVYLALAYLELYVSQQEILKKKTAEEMESLGPLIKSTSNVEVNSGEDVPQVTSDGTSLDAVSYSYLNLELELKNQEWMVKCLQQWEEIVQFGWLGPEQYSNQIFNCIKSLGYHFSLIGNSFFSSRAWSILLKFGERNSDDFKEEFVLSASELLKLGCKVDSVVLERCKQIVEAKQLLVQDELFFHIGIAWSEYFQHNFAEAWKILDEKVLQSKALNSEPSKSTLLLIAQANLLVNLLAILPEELSHIPPSEDIGPIQSAYKSAQMAFSTLKYYEQQKNSWKFYGQEWNVLGQCLVTTINTGRMHLYIGSPRETRFYLKEALNLAQKHVSVLRTAEALLELCNLDLMLDSVIDCRSKLVLICHLMAVAPPVIPDTENIPSSDGKKSFETAISPVHIRTDRRKINGRKVPEIAIQVQQDATQRALQLPLNHQGASPTTKARELSGGIFPEHISDCICLTCSSELVMSIRCSALLVQSKLWSLLGFQELANEDFLKGHQLVQSMCSRLKRSTKSVSVKSSSKRLFDVPSDCFKINETWAQYKMNWFQPPIVTGMELLMENAMHRLVTESTIIPPSELLIPVKSLMYEFYLGPLEHRVIKLTSAIATISLHQPTTCSVTPEQKSNSVIEEDDVIILDEEFGHCPKTPAIGLRKPIEMPPPRRVRRNLMANKIDDTITIDDEEDSDVGFSRRRLGQPQKAIIYSSDSDTDVIPESPSPEDPKVKEPKKTKALIPKKIQELSSPVVDLAVLSVEKKYPNRGTLKSSESKSKDLDIRPETEKRSTTTKTKSNEKTKATVVTAKTTASCKAKSEADLDLQQPAASAKMENKFFKSKTTKKDVEVSDLSSRLAATKLNPETKETRPKRTTRSTRK